HSARKCVDRREVRSVKRGRRDLTPTSGCATRESPLAHVSTVTQFPGVSVTEFPRPACMF
ncbi:MAG TPA: hypothetical protein VK386_03615, partial [Acidimicrobiales bacterium]|nr:hypothetical protein [Acidimicrobiales bacterium]